MGRSSQKLTRMSPRKIIIDTDPGIDDSLAILLALASPELQVEALTIVSGNCVVEDGVKNALSVLELAGATHIPVAQGMQVPLIQPLLIAPETHGETGIGYARLPAPQTSPVSQHAADLLIEKIVALLDVSFLREYDDQTGYPELVVRLKS